MIQETSREIYNQIKNNGLLGKMQFMVYEFIYEHGPVTANELFMAKQMKTNQSGRFTELSQMDVIYEAETRKCDVTGNNAIAWNVTNRIPDKSQIKKYSSKAEILKKIKGLGIQLSGQQRLDLLEIYKLGEEL
jgi:hypothetical protein